MLDRKTQRKLRIVIIAQDIAKYVLPGTSQLNIDFCARDLILSTDKLYSWQNDPEKLNILLN
tara:strand:- start:17246 stop:17431 length:186 start_codon:yes stop_codon:yes gene_type:complete